MDALSSFLDCMLKIDKCQVLACMHFCLAHLHFVFNHTNLGAANVTRVGIPTLFGLFVFFFGSARLLALQSFNGSMVGFVLLFYPTAYMELQQGFFYRL